MAQNKWNISEKELEDWFYKNPEALYDGLEIIDRQVVLSSGRLDLLAYNQGVFIIELKAGQILRQHIEQILRYKRDITAVLTHVCLDNSPVEPGFCDYTLESMEAVYYHIDYYYAHGWKYYEQYLDYAGIHPDYKMRSPITALVGTSVDDKVRVAAQAGGIKILLWKFDKESCGIQVDHQIFHPEFTYIPHPRWATEISKRIERDTLKLMRHKKQYAFQYLMQN